ncbi:transglycosylase SLT domain-containing protein [Priestia megaterium]|uniref:transglycosylase SLT domain-containing protein n=1 Tax=Priestia megaterium TaxID=1404 RepID=UPI003CC612AA
MKKLGQGLLDIFKGAFQLIWNAVQLLFIGKILKGIGGFVKAFGGALKGGWTKALANLKGFVNDSTGFFKGFYTKGKKWFDDTVEAAKNLPQRMGDGIAKMKDKATAGIKSLANHMVGMLATGVNGAINGVNWVLKKIGVDEKNHIDTWTPPHYKNGTKAGGHQGGYFVAGDGGEPEIIEHTDGTMEMSPAKSTLYYGEKGTRVYSGSQTKRILKDAQSYGVPMYDSGTFGNVIKGVGKKIAEKAGAAKDKVVDTAVSVKNKAVSGAKAMGEKVKDIWSYVDDPSKLMKLAYEKFIPKLPSVAGAFGKIGGALVKKTKDKLVTFIGDKMAEMMPTDSFGGSSSVAQWYLDNFRVSTPFSPNKGLNDGWHGGGHKGIDLARKGQKSIMGMGIKSLTDGIISQVLLNNPTAGNGVRVKTGNRTYSYIHMQDAPPVKVGQKVSMGQILGRIGSTGRSSGAHLDLKITEGGKYINPLTVLKDMAASGGGAGVRGGSWNGQYKDIIKAKAAKYGVSPALIAGIIQQESVWNPNARSPVGATGLMQLMPATARSMGVRNPRNPEQNIDGGTKYIKQMLNMFKGNLDKALRGYNAGPGNVLNGRAYKLKETNDYVRKVTANIRRFGGQFFSGGVAEHPQFATLAENGWKEFIIPTEPKYRNRAKSLVRQASAAIGMQTSSAPSGQDTASTINNTTTYNITINAPAGADNKTIAKQVIAEIEKKNKRQTRPKGYVS